MKQKKLNFYRTIIFLSKYLKGNYLKFFSFCFGWLTQSAITIVTPIVFGVMIDQIVYYGNVTSFFSLGAVFVLTTVFSCVLYYFIYEIYAHILVTFTSAIKKDVFIHLIDSEAKVLSDIKTGELINTIQTYPNDCMDFVVRNIIHNLNGILLILFSSFYIIKINMYIGCLILVCIPIGTIVNLIFGKKIRYYGDQRRARVDKFMSWVLEMISGVSDLRLLGAEKYVIDDFSKQQHTINHVINKSKFYILTAGNIIDGTNLMIQMSIYLIMAILMVKVDLSIGNIMIVMAYFTILAKEMKQLCIKYMDLQNRIAGIQRIKDFLESDLEKNREGKDVLDVKKGKIEVENLDFSYDKTMVLNNFNCCINAGERVAIVGKSGCGKSTFANLLLGYYLPKHGSIKIDGKNLIECTLESIRNEIGVVQQNVFLIDGTIRENLLLGQDYMDDDKILQGCKQAGLSNLLDKLPKGIDTVIGSNGILLSGGEKQRLAIARIYLRNPKIIVFDEATSALDAETEKLIHKEWEKALVGRTSVIIAHRQSSVLHCNRVLLIEDGKVAVTGTLDEMLTQDKFLKLFAIKKEA